MSYEKFFRQIHWLQILLAGFAAIILLAVFVYIVPDQDSFLEKLNKFAISALPSAFVVLVGIPIVYFLFTRWGISKNVELEHRITACFSRLLPAYDAGIDAVHLNRGDNEFYQLLFDAERIDAMYCVGQTFSSEHGETLVKAVLENKCRVRVLVCDPKCTVWKNSISAKALDGAGNHKDGFRAVEKTYAFLIEKIRKAGGVKGTLVVKTYLSAPTMSMVTINGKYARVIPYLPYTYGPSSPNYDMNGERNPALLKTYQSCFDEVWRNAKPLLSTDGSK